MAEPIHYTNRKGKTYYLHAATTKTGRTRYVMTRAEDGALTKLPEGYAITETVNGQVSVGHIQPRLITDAEQAMIKSELERLGLNHYRCDVKGTYITVYEPLRREDDYSPILKSMGIFAFAMKEHMSEMIEKGPCEPVMRFRVFDQEKRIFEVQRMTYRGEGGWRSLHQFGPLEDLVRKYLKHLGQDSFYELM
jgi:hypothetical protein